MVHTEMHTKGQEGVSQRKRISRRHPAGPDSVTPTAEGSPPGLGFLA